MTGPTRLLVLVAYGWLLACLWLVFGGGTVPVSRWYPRDGWTYLAAGERLNAGHPLYSLVAGDRPVLLDSRISLTPLLSPPPIAVLWRPLALFGEPAAIAWWVVCIVALLGTVIVLTRRTPVATAVATLLLALSIATEVSVGNVDSLIVPGLVGLWLLSRSGRWRAAAWLAVVLAAVKVLPIFAIVWLFATGPRRRLLIAAAPAVIVVGLASIVGAGLQANVDYIAVLGSTATQGRLPLSISGLATQAGLPFAALASTGGALIAAALVIVLRRRPAVSFTAAIIGMLVATTAASLGTFVLLIPILAPLGWPSASPRSLSAPQPITSPATSGTRSEGP